MAELFGAKWPFLYNRIRIRYFFFTIGSGSGVGERVGSGSGFISLFEDRIRIHTIFGWSDPESVNLEPDLVPR